MQKQQEVALCKSQHTEGKSKCWPLGMQRSSTHYHDNRQTTGAAETRITGSYDRPAGWSGASFKRASGPFGMLWRLWDVRRFRLHKRLYRLWNVPDTMRNTVHSGETPRLSSSRPVAMSLHNSAAWSSITKAENVNSEKELQPALKWQMATAMEGKQRGNGSDSADG